MQPLPPEAHPQKSRETLLQEVLTLEQELQLLRQQLQNRNVEVEQLKQAYTDLKQQFSQRTAALKESNDTLVAEVVERSQAQEALHKTTEQLQAILDAVPGIVSWISDDLRYLGVNQHLANAFNLPKEAFVGQDIGFLHTSQAFNNFVKDFFQSPHIDAYREISANVSGVYRRFLIVAQKYNQGKAAFTVGIDITERNKAEEALREAEAKYRNIFENTVEGIFQTTPDGKYLSANPALARIYGYRSAEEILSGLTNIQHQLYVDGRRRDEFIHTLQTQDAIVGFESEIYRKDGTSTWISENARAVRDEAGTLQYYEGTVRDITARKTAEAALQKANEELENRVIRRTAALTEANQRLLNEIQERQRIEAALRASEAELRALFAAMTDVITVFDSEGLYLNIVATNAALLYSPAVERVGNIVYDVLPPAQATLFMRHIQRALNSGQPVRLEYSLPIGPWQQTDETGEETQGDANPDDFENTAWYAAIVSPMPDGRVIWVARDITERRRADLALQQAEEKYRSIFENAAEGIFQVTPEGHYISANPALARMYGYPNPEALIEQVQAIDALYVDPLRRQLLRDTLHRDEAVTKFESQLYRADGSVIWISENIRAVKDDADCLCYYEGTAADITQRKHAEQALKESQRTLATLLGNLAGMAYRRLCDEGRTLVFVSHGCYELTGYQPEDLIARQGVSFGTLVHPDDHDYVGEQLATALAGQTPFQMVYRIMTAQGREKWVLEKGIGVFTPAGDPVAIEGFLTDISDRKQIEEALQVEQEKSEQLLLNVLPQPIAAELKQNPSAIAYRFEAATILFADIVNFTQLSASVEPTELVDLLNQIFSNFDQLAEKYGLEKIKTIGDAYMVVGGVPNPRDDHMEAIAEMALEMQASIANFQRADGRSFALRIGIDSGPVVAGVIGIKKFSYDLWGDAVNVASRMESQGVGGRIQVTANIYEQLRHRYRFNERGEIIVKGKGLMITHWLLGQL
ncbi:MAG: adenylate/guanylate cyclase domain-containing protein [Cyanobacteria bacterium P01_A01_bin.123]